MCVWGGGGGYAAGKDLLPFVCVCVHVYVCVCVCMNGGSGGC